MRVWFMCLRCLEFKVAGVVSAWGLKFFFVVQALRSASRLLFSGRFHHFGNTNLRKLLTRIVHG